MALRLTNLRSDDRLTFSRAEQFLLEHPDRGVRLRPEEQIARALETGLGLLVERDGQIQGLSLVYPYETPSDARLYSEIGTMRITANGLGLQVALASLHLFQIRLEEWDPIPPSVFAVVTPGTASEHNLEHGVRMSTWEPPLELQAVRRNAGVPFDPAKRVLVATPDSFTGAQTHLRGMHLGGNHFRTPKGGDVFELDLGWFDSHVLTLEL